MQEVVIVAATRTPTGAFLGALSPLSAVQLGTTVVQALLAKAAIAPQMVDEVIMGQVLTAGCGQNPARQVAVNAGIPCEKPAMTINQVCGSGLKAVQLAVQSIRCGDASIVVAGGQESMSQAPYLLKNARDGLRLGDGKLTDSIVCDGLWDVFNNYHMGITAENLAEKYAIDRQMQDAFALQSQQKAAAAQQAGRFIAEITPVSIPRSKGEPLLVSVDEQPRADTSAQGLAKLRPAFRKPDGTVTAGNASSLNDGAAAVLLMSAGKARELKLPVLARVAGYAVSGVAPEIMGIGPVTASQQCLQRAGWQLADLDLIEANEAFAVQALAVGQQLGWDNEKVNVNGGAIALGHAIGASGCRILVTLLHEMQRRKVAKGLATLCVGGGMGVALAVEQQ